MKTVSDDPDYQAVTYLTRAIGAARSGQLDQARKDIEQVKAITKTLREKKKTEEADFLDRPNCGTASLDSARRLRMMKRSAC